VTGSHVALNFADNAKQAMRNVAELIDQGKFLTRIFALAFSTPAGWPAIDTWK